MKSSQSLKSSAGKAVVALLIIAALSGEASAVTYTEETKDMGAVKNVLSYLDKMKEASEKHGVPLAVIASTMEHESSGRKTATSYHTATESYKDSKGNQVNEGDFISWAGRRWNSKKKQWTGKVLMWEGKELKHGDLVHRLSDLKGNVKQKNGKMKFTWLSSARPSYPVHIARGLMQCIENTAALPLYGGYTFDELYDAEKSIDCGTRVLKDLSNEIGGTWDIRPIAAGYFSGKGNALAAKDGFYSEGKRRDKKQGDPYVPGKGTRKYMDTAEELLKQWEERLANVDNS